MKSKVTVLGGSCLKTKLSKGCLLPHSLDRFSENPNFELKEGGISYENFNTYLEHKKFES